MRPVTTSKSTGGRRKPLGAERSAAQTSLARVVASTFRVHAMVYSQAPIATRTRRAHSGRYVAGHVGGDQLCGSSQRGSIEALSTSIEALESCKLTGALRGRPRQAAV